MIDLRDQNSPTSCRPFLSLGKGRPTGPAIAEAQAAGQLTQTFKQWAKALVRRHETLQLVPLP